MPAAVMGADPRAIRTERGAGVVADQDAAVAPRVPRPRFVADAVSIGPIYDSRNVARAAVRVGIALAGLSEDKRHPAGDRCIRSLEARRVATGVPTIDVGLRDQLVTRVARH